MCLPVVIPKPQSTEWIICLFDFIVDSNPSPTKDFSPKQTSGWIFFPHKVLTTAVSIQYFGLELSMTFLLGVILVSRKPRRIDQDIEVEVSAERGWCGERHSFKGIGVRKKWRLAELQYMTVSGLRNITDWTIEASCLNEFFGQNCGWTCVFILEVNPPGQVHSLTTDVDWSFAVF